MVKCNNQASTFKISAPTIQMEIYFARKETQITVSMFVVS